MRRPLFVSALVLATAQAALPQAASGKATYDTWCAGCHGDKGDGDGDGATTMLPRPRDFRPTTA